MTNKKNKAGRLDMGGDGEAHHGTDSSRVHGSLEFGVEIEKKIKLQYQHVVDEHLIDESFAIIRRDKLVDAACAVICEAKYVSTTLLQQRLKISCVLANTLMDVLEEIGIIGPPVECGPRGILIDLKKPSV